MDLDGALLGDNGKMVKKKKLDSWKLCTKSVISSTKEDKKACNDDFDPWLPVKNYSCSFCKREFKSAQALGGHMNVHRRDRARLRLLPSWVAQNQNQQQQYSIQPYHNPNPNYFFSCSNFCNKLDHHNSPSSLTHLTSSVPSSVSSTDIDHQDKCFIVEKDHHHHQFHAALKEKNGSVLNLDLHMGFFDGSNDDGSSLDLELRL